MEVACWAHVRRKFHEALASRVAHEALASIGQLYAVERELRESCAGVWSELALDEWYDRIASARQARAAPLLTALPGWHNPSLEREEPKSRT
jgi:hypothetical protein